MSFTLDSPTTFGSKNPRSGKRRSKPDPNRWRERRKDITVPGGYLYVQNVEAGGDPIVVDTGSTSVIRFNEYMRDTRGFLQCDNNPCEHHDFQVVHSPPMSFEFHLDGHPWTFTHPGGWFPEDIESVLQEWELPDFGLWLDDFSANAEYHFVTAVDSTHSLLNFIIELIEVCEGNVVKLKELITKIQEALKLFHKLYAQTGNYWLSWNFAIKPTVKDVKSILNSVENAIKRFRWLKARNHLDTKVQYREGPREFSNTLSVPVKQRPAGPSGPGIVPFPNPFPTVHFEIDIKVKVTLAAQAWVRFDIPDYLLEDETCGIGIVWSSLNGLYDPLGVVWEAFPFSWLIDWFLSRREQLERLRQTSIDVLPDATLLQVGHSVKIELAEPADMFLVDSLERIPAGTIVQYESYIRRVGFPEVESNPFRVPRELYNLSILLALIQQKFRRG